MEIGEEGKPFIAEPIEDPFQQPEPTPVEKPEPMKAPEPEKVPA